MKDDSVYLHHILECIRRIEADTTDDREQSLASHTQSHQDHWQSRWYEEGPQEGAVRRS